jgi:steroid 5-alpha reductase family enzyme
MSELLLGSFVWIMLLIPGLWVVSVRLSDVSIVDVFRGVGFLLIAWRNAFLADGLAPRQF